MKNVIFMTNIRDESKLDRSEPYKYSVKSWKYWCEKNNVDRNKLLDRSQI